MTPAGRPPRSSSSSKKTISIRVTEEEHALLTKAARGEYVSEWLRSLALKAATPVENPTTSVQLGVALEALAELVPEEKREKFRESTREFSRIMETTIKHFEDRIADLTYELINQDLDIAKKFARYIKHDRGCKGRPCSCSLKDDVINISTARAMGGVTGDIPLAD